MRDDIEILELFNRLDLNKLDGNWNIASKEEQAIIKKDYKLRLRIIRVCGAVIFFTISLMFILLYSSEYEYSDLVGIGISLGAVILIYLVIYFLYLQKYKQIMGETVYSLRVCVWNARYENDRIIISFWYKDVDGSLKTKVVIVNELFIKQKKSIEFGDCIRIIKLNNIYHYIEEGDVKSIIKDENSDQGLIAAFDENEITNKGDIIKIEEKKIVNGNDHRLIQFYIKEDIRTTDFFAIVDRLDISDDRPVYKYREYFVESHDINDDEKPVYDNFVEDIIWKISKKMTS